MHFFYKEARERRCDTQSENELARAKAGSAAQQQGTCTWKKKDKGERRRASFLSLSLCLSVCVCVCLSVCLSLFVSLSLSLSLSRARHSAQSTVSLSSSTTTSSLSIVHGTPWPEPCSPLPRPFTGVARHAPSAAAGRALLAPVLERAEPLGADSQGPAAPAELAAAGAGASAAVTRGRRGFSLRPDRPRQLEPLLLLLGALRVNVMGELRGDERVELVLAVE